MFEELKKLQKHNKPIESSRYHKPYVEGECDYFIGITTPNLRSISKRWYKTISDKDLETLMAHTYHEYRLLALIILNDKMAKATLKIQKQIIEFYLRHLEHINNWDLVDVSAYSILGKYLYNIQDYSLLYEFSESDDLWIKRISIVATNYLIKNNELSVPLDIIDRLLTEKHDLIHKANGWMLRNLGDKDKELLTEYLFVHYNNIPRTTLRYAIEHYPEQERKAILKGEFQWK